MMEGMLKWGQVLIARNMQSAAVIEDTLGEGAQAEVYRARIGDAHYALKWYEVVANPLGLKNLSPDRWTTRTRKGSVLEVKCNEVLPLVADCHIHFGKTEAEIRIS
jgi:hypothetical protein